MLTCIGLRKDYVTERGAVAAVAGIDLEVAAGRFAAIIGRSGSGKSSLMAMIGGLSRPSAGQGIVAGGALTGAGHIEAGWGIRAAHDIVAQGAIKAGESLVAGGVIRAGQGYGVYAGLNVQRDAWEASAQVCASERPAGLLSGCWVA